jgi:hypothetical protein
VTAFCHASAIDALADVGGDEEADPKADAFGRCAASQTHRGC